MWDCIKCGVKAIAGTLGFCPGCFKPKEDEVPKATSGGASNAAAEPGEPGYIDPAAGQVQAAEALLGPGGPADDTDKAASPAKSAPEKPAEPPAKAADPVPAPKQEKPVATGSEPLAPRFAPLTDPPAKDS